MLTLFLHHPIVYIMKKKLKSKLKCIKGHLDCSVLAAVSEIKIWQQKYTGTKNALIGTNNANSERYFSTLKRLKTYLRNTTCDHM
jgi:hypothetical protein